MQFSLKWLLIAIAFVAFSLVAMLNANELWRIGFRTAVIFSGYIALLGALFSLNATRVFCAGYTIVAISFLTNFCGADWGSHLITENALSAIHSRIFAPVVVTIGGDRPIETIDGDIIARRHNVDGTTTLTYIRPDRFDFLGVGHSVLSVALGVIGGFIAVAFYRRRSKTSSV